MRPDSMYEYGSTSSRLNADAHGADPNRNYPFFWGGEGGGSDKHSQTYGGAEPFSEPEARNIAGGMKARQVTAYLTNHTYGKLCMRPWGYTTDESPADAFQDELGERMCAHNGYRNQIGLSLYPTAGTSRDWAYGALRTIVYTFEHGKAFHPAYASEIPSTYEMNRPAWLLLAEAAADARNHGVITGKVVKAGGGPAAGVPVTVTEAFQDPGVRGRAGQAGRVGAGDHQLDGQDRPARALHPPRESVHPTDHDPGGCGKEHWTVKIGKTSRQVFLDRGTKADLGTIKL